MILNNKEILFSVTLGLNKQEMEPEYQGYGWILVP